MAESYVIIDPKLLKKKKKTKLPPTRRMLAPSAAVPFKMQPFVLDEELSAHFFVLLYEDGSRFVNPVKWSNSYAVAKRAAADGKIVIVKPFALDLAPKKG